MAIQPPTVGALHGVVDRFHEGAMLIEVYAIEGLEHVLGDMKMIVEDVDHADGTIFMVAVL